MTSRLPAAFLLLVVAACQSFEQDPCELPGEGPFLPLAVGNWWLYDVSDNYEPRDKTQVVRDYDPELGRFQLEKLACDPDNTWIDETPGGYLWPRKLRFYPTETWDIYYEPTRTKWRTRGLELCEGADWSDDYDEVSVRVDNCPSYEAWNPYSCPEVEIEQHHDLWRVEGTQSCSVGEHEYQCVCQWRDDGDGPGTFCYARGVGKVTETTDTVEQLLDFCIDGLGPGGVPYPDGVCPDPPDPREDGC